MLFFNFIGAGDVVAAALPNLKCLRDVTVWMMVSGPKCPPVWPLHSTLRRWGYCWKILTSISYGPVYPVSATASLCRNWMCVVQHPVSVGFYSVSVEGCIGELR